MNRPYTKSCFKHGSRRHWLPITSLLSKVPPSLTEPLEPAATLSREEKGRYSQSLPPLALTATLKELLQVLDLLKTSARATEIPSELSDNVPTQIWMSCQNYIIIFFLNHYTLKSELPWWLHWLHLQCHYWQSNASYSDTSSRRFSSHISTSRNLKPVLRFWLLLLHHLSAWNRLCPNHTTWTNGSSGSNYKTNSALALISTPTVNLLSKKLKNKVKFV